MVRFESVTESEAFKRYNKDNPNAQIPPRKTPSFYELQDYIIAINDDGEVVGTAGWKDYGDYAVVGGMHSRAGSGTWRLLGDERRRLLGRKPKLAGYNAKKMPTSKWISMNQSHYADKLEINPKEITGVPVEMIENFKERYGANWGILKNTNSWFDAVKREGTDLCLYEE